MTLIKTGLVNGLAVIVRMLTLLGLNKILAVYVGPSGYAIIGQFQNAIQIISTFAAGAVNTGVTKYTAEYHADSSKQREIWRAASFVTVLGGLFFTFIIVALNRYLAKWFLGSEALGDVFIWFAIGLVFSAYNVLLLAILNGKKEINKYVIANISGSLFALIIVFVMVTRWGLYGALVALATYQSLSFIATFLLFIRIDFFHFNMLFGRVNREAVKRLFKFTAMALASVISVPVSHILIRNHLGQTLGWESAGNWEALWRFSGAYSMLFMTTLSVYYLPRYAEIKSYDEIKREFLYGYKILLPIYLAFQVIVYCAFDNIVPVLFTDKFSLMEEAIEWQLLGDFLKFGSWIVAFVMHSKGMMKLFIVTEILFSVSLYFLIRYFSGEFGFKGVGIGYAINYFFYWFIVYVAVRKNLKEINE